MSAMDTVCGCANCCAPSQTSAALLVWPLLQHKCVTSCLELVTACDDSPILAPLQHVLCFSTCRDRGGWLFFWQTRTHSHQWTSINRQQLWQCLLATKFGQHGSAHGQRASEATLHMCLPGQRSSKWLLPIIPGGAGVAALSCKFQEHMQLWAQLPSLGGNGMEVLEKLLESQSMVQQRACLKSWAQESITNGKLLHGLLSTKTLEVKTTILPRLHQLQSKRDKCPHLGNAPTELDAALFGLDHPDCQIVQLVSGARVPVELLYFCP